MQAPIGDVSRSQEEHESPISMIQMKNTNNPMSKNIHPSATANKAKHCLKLRCVQNQREYIILTTVDAVHLMAVPENYSSSGMLVILTKAQTVCINSDNFPYKYTHLVSKRWYYAFFLVCCGCDTSYKVLLHIQCQASSYTISLCRGHSWRVRLAKQETLTPPGHLVSFLVSGVRERPPWCSIVGATVTVHQFFCILLKGPNNVIPKRSHFKME